MSVFRKDPFGSAWVLISPERGLEPSDFGRAAVRARRSPLSPGAEATFREIDARRPAGSRTGDPNWRMRVVEQPSALLHPQPFEVEGEEPFRRAPSHGRQEMVIEHPDAQARLESYSDGHLVDLLRLWRTRLAGFAHEPHARHVQVTRNVGEAAGAAYPHPHSLLLSSPVPSRWIEEEVTTAAAHHARTDRCLFCEVATAERRARERVVASNDGYVAIAPYASRTPFETWILPHRHGCAFAEEPANDLPALASILRTVVRATVTALSDPPYNLVLHTLPRAGDPSYHWHIELLPRLTQQSGFDWGNGFYVNPTPPEYAANFLREAMAMQDTA